MAHRTPAPAPSPSPSPTTRTRLGVLCGFLTPAAPGPSPAYARLVPVLPLFQRLPAVPRSAGRARRTVLDVLGGTDQADTAALLTSELVTNAVTHGPSGEDRRIELTVWRADGHWWVAVADAGDLMPATRSPSPGSEGGRGLLLVTSLAAAWGVLPRPGTGKAVWFALPASPH